MNLSARKPIYLSLSIFLLGTVLFGNFPTNAAPFTTAEAGHPDKPPKVLRHVVLLKFKEATTPAQVKSVEDAFRALLTKIKAIKSLEWGTNNSPENLAQGFTHCFFLTFAREQDRAAYLPHPAHQAFGKVLSPYLDKVLVVDYWTEQ